MSLPGGSSAAWERGTARVLHNGRPVGVAFLIPGRLLLTCAHVISSIAGLPDGRPLPARFPVTVDFPLLPGHPEAAATVHFSVPVAADNSGDVAVLRLTGEAPAGAVAMRILEADDLAGHRWRAFGFPRYPEPVGGRDAGVWTRGTVEGREGTGWWQLTCDEGAGFPLAGGFSGAPVWDEEYRGVIGVVVAVEGDQRRRTGYALTVESLAREWPQLRSRLLDDSPFRELLPFTEHDSAVFHGRAGETRRLLELLGEQQVPILPVLGASGVGKSSLTGAGLLAHVDHGSHLTARLPHGLRLTAEELLAWALASAGDADTRKADWHDRWSALARRLGDEHGLRTALEQTLARHDGRTRLLLVLDQFETLLADAPETARKLDAMLGVLTTRRADGSRPAQAVVVSRIDFLPQIEQLPNLRTAWETTHVVVPPMTRDQLREAVTRPLEGHAGIRFADGLVEQLLHDTPRGAAALPMLEYTLSQLWARQERGFLTATAYQELGGVEGALVGNAERTLWEWADGSEHEALERIFIQLVRPAERLDAGEHGPDMPRVADRTQFSEHDWSLIHRLASTRLVVVTRRPNGLDTAELAHQALVESWPRLQGWVERNRDFRSWQEEIRRTVRAWQERGRPQELTLGRHRIDEAKRWLGARAAEVSPEETEFVQASIQAQHRIARRRRFILTGFAFLAVLVLLASGLAALNARTSDQQRDMAATQRLTSQSRREANTDPALAARLALAAQHIHPTADTRALLLSTLTAPLRATLTGHTSPVSSVAVSPDGNTLATGSRDRTVRLWDVRTHRLRATLTGHSRSVGSVAFSPDGKTLATGGEDRTVRLWDVRTHRRLATLTGSASPVVFSPDGKTLATGGDQGRVRLWDVRNRRPLGVLKGHTGGVWSVAFSPDGKLLATGSHIDGTVRLWDVRARRHLAVLTSSPGSVVFSPDGETMAVGGDAKEVELWDVRTRRRLTTFTGHTGTVASMVFSPDGKTLATGSWDTTVRLWDVRTHRHLTTLTGHTDSVQSVAFGPDGNTLGSGGRDTTARLWDVRTHRRLATLTGHTGIVWSVALSRDGNTLATTSDDRTVRLWDVRTRRQLTTLTGHTSRVESVVFNPDGNTLASGSFDETVLWDSRMYKDLRTLIDGVCAIAGRSMTHREWRQHVPAGVAYRRICP
ncbi:trypsin-like peptidase domain-containing protein [Streptomyces xinghaiensis]|uniref:nSTAND1 domain-containing NTPase n=1 Tax=Streptomyces xinghaiensis TaxID=1038928 RepID=UPI0037B4E2EF